jgi:hypothetical protein
LGSVYCTSPSGPDPPHHHPTTPRQHQHPFSRENAVESAEFIRNLLEDLEISADIERVQMLMSKLEPNAMASVSLSTTKLIVDGGDVKIHQDIREYQRHRNKK